MKRGGNKLSDLACRCVHVLKLFTHLFPPLPPVLQHTARREKCKYRYVKGLHLPRVDAARKTYDGTGSFGFGQCRMGMRTGEASK